MPDRTLNQSKVRYSLTLVPGISTPLIFSVSNKVKVENLIFLGRKIGKVCQNVENIGS